MDISGKKASNDVSSSSMASDENLQVYCQPCEEEKLRFPAHGYCTDCNEHLCKNCFTVHKTHKLSKHHILLDATSMPKSLQQPCATSTKLKLDNLTIPCVRHPQEMTMFYCKYHKELLCSVCVSIEHQSNPCKVNYIPDISGNIIDSKDYEETLKAVNNTVDHSKAIAEDVRKMTVKSNSSIKNVIADIKKFQQEINDRLDVLVRQAIDVAIRIEQDNNNNLKKVEATCIEVTKSLTTSLDTIKQLNTSGKADELFMELKHAEKIIKDVHKNMRQHTSYDVKEHSFKPDESILAQITTKKSFGALTQKSLIDESQNVLKKSVQLSHQEPICVATIGECNITGMTLVNPDLLIITDNAKGSIMGNIVMVDIKKKTVSDQLQLDGVPGDITSVTSSKLAVTLQRKCKVQFLSISSKTKKLKKKHSIKVDGNCYGISYNQGNLVVSFCDPAKLQIIEMNGSIVEEIDGKNIFKVPWYVTTSSSSIYVSDWHMRTVTMLNWQGEVIGSYGGMDRPVGITMSDVGTFFVCDWAKSVIEEILGDCCERNILYQTRYAPNAVCWCAETRRLYYTCRSGAGIFYFDNFIHICKT